MAWTVDDTKALKKAAVLTINEEKKYDDWVMRIRAPINQHPKEAAKSSDMDYEQTNSKMGIFQVRLGGKQRVSFQVNEKDSYVKILEIGGHL